MYLSEEKNTKTFVIALVVHQFTKNIFLGLPLPNAVE